MHIAGPHQHPGALRPASLPHRLLRPKIQAQSHIGRGAPGHHRSVWGRVLALLEPGEEERISPGGVRRAGADLSLWTTANRIALDTGDHYKIPSSVPSS
jgi:hypothetical protein